MIPQKIKKRICFNKITNQLTDIETI
jgi:hypothetical protein